MDKTQFVGADKHEYCPFIREKTEHFLIELLKQHQPKKILEIGTFLGYSASVILKTCPNAFLTTVEKDFQNFLDSQINLKAFENVKIINADALDFLKDNKDKFDFIFLDGAKGQYYKYLPYLKECLNLNGILFADDVLFYDLVLSDQKIEHKHRTIVNNLRKFLQTLQEDEAFETQIYKIDDGFSVSTKIK